MHRYVKAHLTNDTMLKISLPKKGGLLILLTYFILCRPVSVKVTGKKNKVAQRPQPYTALEELQVMVSVLNKIEEQKNIEQQFCMFEALFGGCEDTIQVSGSLSYCSSLSSVSFYICDTQTGARAGETFFERVVCLAVNLQSCATLTCIALWMQVGILHTGISGHPQTDHHSGLQWSIGIIWICVYTVSSSRLILMEL